MTKKITLIALTIAALFISNTSSAQDGLTATHLIAYTVPKVALVDIEGPSSISLTLVPPTEAGLGMDMSATNSSLWMNYSSTTASSATNTVSVKSSITLPGVDLKVLASTDAGGGDGTVGSPSSIVTLSTTDQNIITNIGTCYTGDGVNKGHNLTYSLATTAYNLIKFTATPASITVTYTITNN